MHFACRYSMRQLVIVLQAVHGRRENDAATARNVAQVPISQHAPTATEDGWACGSTHRSTM